MGEKTSLTIKIILASLFTTLVVVFAFTDNYSLGSSDSDAEDVSADALVGTADGHNGPLTVAVTMDGDTITDVVVTDHTETEGLADPAISDVPAAIVEANSTDVDVASGATITSEAIVKAVEIALGQEVDEEATEQDEPVEYTDGTYEGTTEGFGGTLSVEVTVTDGVIANVVVTEHSESDGIADPAFEEVPAAIIEYNSTNVDVASGATVSSNAIMRAVKDALGDAQ